MKKCKNCAANNIIACILVLVILLSGCTKTNNRDEKKNAYQPDYEIGIIKTSPEKIGTDIIYLDSNLREVRTLNYPYGKIGGNGFYTPKIVNNVMYENPLGYGHERDFGTIIGLDLHNGEVKEYPFHRTNITNYIVTEKYLYTISNPHLVTSLDRYCFQDQSTVSMEIDGIVASEMALYENTLFIFDSTSDHSNMYQVDMEQKTYKLVYDLKEWFIPEQEDVGFPLVYQDMLYLPVNNKIIEYDIKHNTFSEIILPHNEARQLLLSDDKLYVSSNNIHDDNSTSAILVIDLETKQVIGNMEFNHSMMQFDVKNDNLYILTTFDVFKKYKLTPAYQATLEQEVELEAGTVNGHFHYISAFFVK